MSIFELIIIAFSLAVDAFLVSIAKGVFLGKKIKYALIIGGYFGIFQAFMPYLGYYLGTYFNTVFIKIDHIIVFLLLFYIGFNMLKSNDSSDINSDLSFKTMLILSIATSMDAFSIGVSLAFFNINIYCAIVLIGFVTFVLSFIGSLIGSSMATFSPKVFAKLGGIFLIILAFKTLLNNI